MTKGISVHVGVKRFFPAEYKDLPNTKSCAADARELERIAKERGFETILLVKGADTVVSRLADAIKTAGQNLDSGEHFLLTFSGHGMAATVGSHTYQAWCLSDARLYRQELATLLSDEFFKAGVRITIVANCCHSGRMKELHRRALTLPADLALELAAFDAERLVTFTERRVFAARAPFRNFGIFAAHVIEIDACGFNDVALDGAEGFPSPFTNEFLRVLPEDYGSFDNFMGRLKTRCTAGGLPPPQKNSSEPTNEDFEKIGPYRLEASIREIRRPPTPEVRRRLRTRVGLSRNRM